ncbi:MAG: hypothetical protein EXR69_16315 [Myxococcales bacterium]|nr:hypothetical protein [Myxococcales bacterium]
MAPPMHAALLVSIAFCLSACAKPPNAAPATLDDMSVALLSGFEGDSPETIAQPLAEWLLEHVDDDDGFTLADIGADDVADMPYDGGEDGDPDFSQQRGIGVTHRVVGTFEEHAAIVPEADQSFADPTYQIWDRGVAEGDADSFVAGADMRTDNFIEKSGAFGVTIAYSLGKDYRWLTLDIGGVATDTLMFRSYELAPGWSEDHNNGLVYGWTIELWVPDPDGDLIWYNASWCQLVTAIDGMIDDDYVVQSIIDGTVDYMDGTGKHATGAEL